ncbi:hypothetical protein M758_2G247300 [Ceratodon purpureus]|nr:hypothetical protein M758_2G247300 [Ceratodon purpureus]
MVGMLMWLRSKAWGKLLLCRWSAGRIKTNRLPRATLRSGPPLSYATRVCVCMYGI